MTQYQWWSVHQTERCHLSKSGSLLAFGPSLVAWRIKLVTGESGIRVSEEPCSLMGSAWGIQYQVTWKYKSMRKREDKMQGGSDKVKGRGEGYTRGM